jgi:hypothetical protein
MDWPGLANASKNALYTFADSAARDRRDDGRNIQERNNYCG